MKDTGIIHQIITFCRHADTQRAYIVNPLPFRRRVVGGNRKEKTNILLVFEYTQVYSYDKDERSNLSITDGVMLNAEYDVYGCFFIIDPCWVDGELESAVTETLVHSTGMVFTDEELMLEQIFYASDRGYDMSVYTESSITEW